MACMQRRAMPCQAIPLDSATVMLHASSCMCCQSSCASSPRHDTDARQQWLGSCRRCCQGAARQHPLSPSFLSTALIYPTVKPMDIKHSCSSHFGTSQLGFANPDLPIQFTHPAPLFNARSSSPQPSNQLIRCSSIAPNPTDGCVIAALMHGTLSRSQVIC